ncbi:MAG: hypothetical protein Q7K65_01640 [Candidatus Buchananbacteria bacterium]|nr:hypothetical protein [Candidatus Buchananbacteria bacterium]
MADDNDEYEDSGGKKQGGKKPPNFPKCPQCGTRPLPKNRDACLVCQPIYRIDADLTRGESQWQILVQTYKNGKQTKVLFAMDVSGQDIQLIKVDDGCWQEEGVAIIPLDFCDKSCTAGFHIVGGAADIREFEIPAETPVKFKPVKPEKNAGFMANLLKGLKK